jgi:hypothetical protein
MNDTAIGRWSCSPLEITPEPEWLEVLARIEEILKGDAYIVGGALRDKHNGRPIKDVDIFIHPNYQVLDDPSILDPDPLCTIDPSVLDPDPIYTILSREGWLSMLLQQYSAGLPDVDGIYEKLIGAWAYNLILLSQPLTLTGAIDRCDFGICRIGCGRDGIALAPAEYYVDVANKTFTLFTPERKERARRRFNRLTADKYTGWRPATP